mmetsp:Transcript_259/g.242  ORF Transcript_259/g.242 Transcript_259/m.242 type:complete len:124 (-) Transcript_259:412-783(-)
MDHCFHNELLNEAQCLESISRSSENKTTTTTITSIASSNPTLYNNTPKKSLTPIKTTHVDITNEIDTRTNTPLTLLPSEIWSEFKPEDVREYGIYYSPRTHSQQISFYENWQRHFQPNDKQST